MNRTHAVHPSNPIGQRMSSLTLSIEEDEHIDAAGTAPYGHFRHDKGCRQIVSADDDAANTASRVFLDHK
ncbi:hypothetical protein HanIR_Chr07g0340261 [Helianthus annuus]|nr:hypothetical protein HanIR_Chr07g0340261 [Helianthus annuus]